MFAVPIMLLGSKMKPPLAVIIEGIQGRFCSGTSDLSSSSPSNVSSVPRPFNIWSFDLLVEFLSSARIDRWLCGVSCGSDFLKVRYKLAGD